MGWAVGAYFLVGFILFAIWSFGAVALAMSWDSGKRWQAWTLIAITGIPALYYPAQIVIVSLSFAL